jgi:hypothetical protein
MPAIIDQMQRVAQIVRRCPEPTLVTAYRDAARKFCLESRWLRREATLLLEPDARLYDIVEPSAADPLLEIIGIRVLTIASESGDARRINPSDPVTWNPAVSARAPTTWAYVPEGQVAFWPTPDAVYTTTITLQVQPLPDAEEVPDDLLRRWDRALADGAIAYLKSIGEQAWTDERGALMYERRFQAAINSARADEQRGYNTGTVMARIRRMF